MTEMVERLRARARLKAALSRLAVITAVLFGTIGAGTSAAGAFGFDDIAAIRRVPDVPAPPPDLLGSGTTLAAGATLTSLNGHKLVMQGDGNLVAYTPDGVPTWSTATDGHPGAHARMLTDGNLVVASVDDTVALWSSGTAVPGSFVIMQDDANVVIYGDGAAQWASMAVAVPDSPGDQGDHGDHGDVAYWGGLIEKLGYAVSEHPAFGGVCAGCHASGSRHYRHQAIDVNWRGPGGEEQKLDELRDWIVANADVTVEILWRVPGHTSHLHLAVK
jgi:hypothetical protein